MAVDMLFCCGLCCSKSPVQELDCCEIISAQSWNPDILSCSMYVVMVIVFPLAFYSLKCLILPQVLLEATCSKTVVSAS